MLQLSEAEAYLRIAAARASREHPALLTMLEDGRLHLSGIAKLGPHLTEANRQTLLARAAHKSKREIEELLAEFAPKPDVPTAVRELPERGEKAKPRPAALLVPDRVVLPSPMPAKAAVVKPLAPARYKVQFTASAELHDKLRRLQALTPGADLASLIEASVTEKLERLEAKRLGKVKNPRKSLGEADTSPGVRAIPAPVRRFVWERDQGQCTFESSEGRRCPDRRGLQFHHNDPYALGGDRSAENVRLLCRVHNLYMAEMDYGKDKMERFTRSADRVGEPTPRIYSFRTELGPHVPAPL